MTTSRDGDTVHVTALFSDTAARPDHRCRIPKIHKPAKSPPEEFANLRWLWKAEKLTR